MLRAKAAGAHPSCFVVAGTHSGVGKTTIATGIMAALRARGLVVQGCKVGPDFIDPTFHTAATGRPGRNLDGWMLPRATNLEIVARAARGADAVVVEGVMGLYDGKSGDSLEGTTAEMALWLGAPVVLVLDASAMAGSAAAVIHGFDTLLPELRIAAVIANRVAGAGHYQFLREAIAARARPELIGYLPRDPGLEIPERHLGLHMAAEALPETRRRALAEAVESNIDLDRLLELSARLDLPVADWAEETPVRARIGVARDRAFCFYYQDNLDVLRSAGAELVEFSPVSDPELPAGLDGIYFGGGYPELHLEALAANGCMRRAVAKFVERGGPVYAECGGFMYLTSAIVDLAGQSWPMVGLFPAIARMQSRLARLGYVEVAGIGRGHEFRYSAIEEMPAPIERVDGGYRVGSAFGSYVHLHFLSCAGFAERFVAECAAFGQEGK